jgi:hypothetical protein
MAILIWVNIIIIPTLHEARVLSVFSDVANFTKKKNWLTCEEVHV